MQLFLEFAAAVFAIVAGYFLFVAFGIDPNVEIDGQYIANAQLMHIQAMDLAIGIGSAVVAAIFLAGAAIVSALRALSKQEGP